MVDRRFCRDMLIQTPKYHSVFIGIRIWGIGRYQPGLSITRFVITANLADSSGSRCSGTVAMACSRLVCAPDSNGACNAPSLGTRALMSSLACSELF